MFLDIRLIQKNDMLCRESAVATVANWYKRNYEMMFAETWGFEFNPQDPDKVITGNMIGLGSWNMTSLLEHYHGMVVKGHNIKSTGDILDISRGELAEERPVLTEFDSYYSPWAPPNEKLERFKTMFLITGIENGKGVHCLDIHFLRRIGFVPMENFLKGAEGCYTFHITGDELKEIDCGGVIRNAVDKLRGKNGTNQCTFEAIRNFSTHMVEAFNFEVEHEDRFNTLNMTLMSVARARALFGMTLKYLCKCCNTDEFIEAVTRMEHAASRWHSVRSLILKSYAMSGFDSNVVRAVADRLNEIAEDEEDISCMLLSRLENSNRTTAPVRLWEEDREKQPRKATELIMVDIAGYANNKAFKDRLSDTSRADLSGTLEYFFSDGLPEGPVWDVGDMKFLFIKPADDVYDNISCKGQTIKIPEGQYDSILMLGCADFENFADSISIKYSDGSKETLQVEFTYWYNEPAYSDVIAWEGDAEKIKYGGIIEAVPFKLRLFASRYPLKERRRMESIQLPNCPEIHVFGLSLEKSVP